MPGFSDHFRDSVSPAGVMDGLFVRSRSILCFIEFDQNKFCWIICLLNYIKARNSWFLHAIVSILNGHLLEIFYKFGLDIYMNMDDQHFFAPDNFHMKTVLNTNFTFLHSLDTTIKKMKRG